MVGSLNMAKKKELTLQQKKFIEEYIRSGNATQAASKAGYKHPRQMGSENLSKPYILKEVTKRMTEVHSRLERKTETTVERIMAEYAKLAFFDARKLFDDDGSPLDISELDDETVAAISGLDVATEAGLDRTTYVRKYRLASRLAALDSLAKIKGLFTEQAKVTVDISSPYAGLTTEELRKLADE
jgi:phage terminase small subunit